MLICSFSISINKPRAVRMARRWENEVQCFNICLTSLSLPRFKVELELELPARETCVRHVITSFYDLFNSPPQKNQTIWKEFFNRSRGAELDCLRKRSVPRHFNVKDAGWTIESTENFYILASRICNRHVQLAVIVAAHVTVGPSVVHWRNQVYEFGLNCLKHEDFIHIWKIKSNEYNYSRYLLTRVTVTVLTCRQSY